MNSIQKFLKTGVYQLVYPTGLHEKVSEALKAWKAFVALDDSLTSQFPYKDGVGFEHQKGGGPTADHKKDFHYTDDGSDFLWKTAQGLPSELASTSKVLLRKAQELIAYLGPTVSEFAWGIEKECGIEDFSQEVLASRGTWFLRFLYYPGDRKPGEHMAVPHIDKSAFTFHLYESDPGLQGLSYADKQWFDTPVSEDATIIFPGFQLQRKSEGRVKALCHQVVANEKTAETGRFSMVVFFSLKNTPKYAKEQGRLQDFEPGFNYMLSPEEVAKRFK